jgi:pimeloyl-ACP methyl ester carboxylesterase
MRAFHCSWLLALVLVAPAVAQAQAEPGSTGYTIFLRGTPIGREDVAVRTDATGTMITSSGRATSGVAFILRRAELKSRPDGSPERYTIDASANGADTTMRTLFKDGVATSEGVQQGKQFSVTQNVSPGAILLPNNVYAAYVGLARRLQSAKAGEELRAFVVPSAEVPLRVASVSTDRVQIGAAFLNVRRYELVVANPAGDINVTITADDQGSLLRLNVAAAALDVVRDDLAASTSRSQVFSNPGDEAVTIPAVGFNIAATLTRPKSGAAQAPAVVLVTGPGVPDRDGFSLGVPVIGQLAGALADAGVLSIRYDKRGTGQSGGRSESATVVDYAEDARAIVRWLSERKDVDPKRIALVGHGDGVWIAMLTATRERRIAGLVSIAGPSGSGADVILEQQQRALDALKLPPAERDQRVALQKQILSAVATGKGWETIPPALRKQADTPWLQSLLTFNLAGVVKDLRQPILFVHGELDRQVPVAHATQLSDLARKESRSPSIEVVVVRGVNHLLVPATTGDIAEYATLTDRNVSGDVKAAVTSWLTKTFAAVK